jgi:hypothetical protein
MQPPEPSNGGAIFPNAKAPGETGVKHLIARERILRTFSHACKIQKTANGRRSGVVRQTRKEKQKLAQRRVQKHVRFNERKAASRFRENETEKIAKEKNEQVIRGEFTVVSMKATFVNSVVE